MKNIDFRFNFIGKSVLSPDEVHFFYYDVMLNNEDSNQGIYEWNGDVEAYLAESGLKIEVKEKGTLPQDVENNVIFFSICQNESKPVALFRHLRNAFAHYRIVHYSDYLQIEDKDGEFLTMKGLIKYQDLKKLCYLFFEQRRLFEEVYHSKV